MSYLYFPGCSLKGLGRAYEESLLATFEALDVDLHKLSDWNCCGATVYMAIDELKAFGLSARNLALAEKEKGAEGTAHLITPCNACYLVLSKAQRYMAEYDDIGRKIDSALQSAGLHYSGQVQIRHPLDVLVNDVGLDIIADRVNRPLTGLKVACYYGCQIVRPYAEFDDQHNPITMEKLLRTLGAEVIDWPLKTRWQARRSGSRNLGRRSLHLGANSPQVSS